MKSLDFKNKKKLKPLTESERQKALNAFFAKGGTITKCPTQNYDSIGKAIHACPRCDSPFYELDSGERVCPVCG